MELLRLRSNPHQCEGTGARGSIIREKENGGGAWEPLRACGHTLAARGTGSMVWARRAAAAILAIADAIPAIADAIPATVALHPCCAI